MQNHIIVNATALHQSGALSILKQFIENIPEDNSYWLIFIPESVQISCSKENVRLEPINGVKPMHKRLWWDAVGLKRWLKRNGVVPNVAISLQNTGFNVGKKVPSFIYYHQSIPFHPYNWSPFKKKERTFWFYRNIYPFFIKLFLRKTTIIFVQLDFIKDGFAKRFNHPKDNIIVCHPTASIPKNTVSQKDISKTLILCYPAMDHFYKNHRVIEKALKLINRDVKLILTTVKSKKSEDNRIERIGVQPFDKVCKMYYSSDALVFPSYIETYGLPLIEAALTGLPIIAADLPYAREVLDGYEGVTFVTYNDSNAWATAIQNLEKGKRYRPIDISNRPGWKELFEKIKTN